MLVTALSPKLLASIDPIFMIFFIQSPDLDNVYIYPAFKLIDLCCKKSKVFLPYDCRNMIVEDDHKLDVYF